MTHEFKEIIEAGIEASSAGVKSVLASVVDLEGSSYRKPGVRMLILEDDSMIGAVSGGCVEKDILRQSQEVFKSGKPMMMTYDGRYRLGCEGILYILIEPFEPSQGFLKAFKSCIENRIDFKLKSWYTKKEGFTAGMGTIAIFDNDRFSISGKKVDASKDLKVLEETLPPCFKLMIFGAEHDAVVLCRYAALNGWEVTIVAGPLESKNINDFPGATAFYSVSPDALELDKIDEETAIVLMSHNFANDLKYLIEIKDTKPAYLGLLGPSHRREKLLDQFLEYHPDTDTSLLDMIHGPAGLDIGAETPQEIAISILSEILSSIRKKTPIPLRNKEGGIHA